jgi:hypothetical protein
VLVLRRSLPVNSNFFGGGYSFSEAGMPRYLIELRARGWSPRVLLDPFYRSAGGLDKTYQVLAEGDVARQLYHEIENTLKQFRLSLKRDFNDSVERLIANIREQVQGTSSSDWKPVQGEADYTGYRGDVNGMTVTIACTIKDRAAHYTMNFMKYGILPLCVMFSRLSTIRCDNLPLSSSEKFLRICSDRPSACF